MAIKSAQFIAGSALAIRDFDYGRRLECPANRTADFQAGYEDAAKHLRKEKDYRRDYPNE